MIEIIRFGKLFATCNGCQAVLKFDQTDIKKEDLGHNDCFGHNDYGEYIVCPVCNKHIRQSYWQKDLNFRQ